MLIIQTWLLLALSHVLTTAADDNSCSTVANDHSASGERSLIQSKRQKQSRIPYLGENPDVPKRFYGYKARRVSQESLLLETPIRDLLTMPSNESYNLEARGDLMQSFSQYAQDKLLDKILGQVKNGFFVESGARDGEAHSNSLWYEMRGWNGLLVEPSEREFPNLLKKHRKCYAFHGCLSPTGTSESVHFEDSGDGLSHIEDTNSFTVPCEPLAHLLGAINRTTVDFWSLDIEGSEGAVLKATDFGKIEVGLLLIEMNKGEANNKEIYEVMNANKFLDIGTTTYSEGILDHIFVNPEYFKKRNLPVPSEV